MREALRHRRILIVEDEYLIAESLRNGFANAGADVVGPFARLAPAMHTLDNGTVIDAAVLDVNLGGERVFPLVDRLTASQIPLIFTTGYDSAAIPPIYAHLPCRQKPVRLRLLLDDVSALIEAH